VADIFRARFLVPIAAPPIEDGALVVDNGRIVDVGHAGVLRKAFPEAGIFDFGEAVIVPPLVNAHTHLELTAFPGWVEEFGEISSSGSFVEWIKQVVRIKKRVPESRFAESLEEGLNCSLRVGTGAIGDILSRPSLRDAYRSVPILGRVFFEILGVDPKHASLSVDQLAGLLGEGALGRISLGASPHAPYSLNEKLLSEVFRLARKFGYPLAIHLAETEEEVRFLIESSGPLAEDLYPSAGLEGLLPPPRKKGPVPYIASIGGLGPNTLAIHGVHVAGDEIVQLARTGTTVVLCPRSNARLGVGKAPVRGYLDAGVPLALGTDSLASSDSLSVWDEIAFARTWFDEQVAPDRLLEMGTRGGAKALGLEGELGELLPGTGAHFQILRPESLPPLSRLLDFLCSPGRTEDVAELFIDGRRVWYN